MHLCRFNQAWSSCVLWSVRLHHASQCRNLIPCWIEIFPWGWLTMDFFTTVLKLSWCLEVVFKGLQLSLYVYCRNLCIWLKSVLPLNSCLSVIVHQNKSFHICNHKRRHQHVYEIAADIISQAITHQIWQKIHQSFPRSNTCVLM